MTKVEELTESIVWMENESWTCGYEDDITVHLCLLVEAVDMRDIDSEHDDDEFPIMVIPEVFVVPADMSEDFKKRIIDSEDGYEKAKRFPEMFLIDAKYYSGGVYVADFLNGVSGGGAKTDIEFSNVRYKGKDYPHFRTVDDAHQYAKDIYACHADALFCMIGFVLDKPVNLVGHTGWDTIALQAENEDRY